MSLRVSPISITIQLFGSLLVKQQPSSDRPTTLWGYQKPSVPLLVTFTNPDCWGLLQGVVFLKHKHFFKYSIKVQYQNSREVESCDLCRAASPLPDLRCGSGLIRLIRKMYYRGSEQGLIRIADFFFCVGCAKQVFRPPLLAIFVAAALAAPRSIAPARQG